MMRVPRGAVLVLALGLSVPYSMAQNLDLNEYNPETINRDAEPLVALLSGLSGGGFIPSGMPLSHKHVRLSAQGVLFFPVASQKAGPLQDVRGLFVPMVQTELAVATGLAIQGHYGASSVGDRQVIVTGYGARYDLSAMRWRLWRVSAIVRVQNLSGPEDFHGKVVSVQVAGYRGGDRVGLSAGAGLDFNRIRLTVAEGGKFVSPHDALLERTLPWAGIGANFRLTDLGEGRRESSEGEFMVWGQWIYYSTHSIISVGSGIEW